MLPSRRFSEPAPEGADLNGRVIDLGTGDAILGLGGTGHLPGGVQPGGALEEGRYLAVNADTVVLEFYDRESGAMMARFVIFPTLVRFDPRVDMSRPAPSTDASARR
jgi:hypothetical protein